MLWGWVCHRPPPTFLAHSLGRLIFVASGRPGSSSLVAFLLGTAPFAFFAPAHGALPFSSVLTFESRLRVSCHVPTVIVVCMPNALNCYPIISRALHDHSLIAIFLSHPSLFRCYFRFFHVFSNRKLFRPSQCSTFSQQLLFR